MRIALGVILLLTPLRAWAGLALDVQFFEDKQATLRADDVAARLDSLPWRKVEKPVPNFGFSSSRIWFRLRVPEWQISPGQSYPLFLEIQNANLERIGFSTLSGGRLTHTSWTGISVPLSQRDSSVLRSGWPAFRLPAPGDAATEYLLSVEGNLPLLVPLDLKDAQEFSLYSWSTVLFTGFFFGLLALAAVFNGFIGVSLRSPLYNSYSLFVVGMMLMCSADAGLSIQLFWPEWPWWALRELHVIGGFTLFFYSQFVRRFLESRRVAPWLDRGLLGMVFVSSVRSLLVFFFFTRTIVAIGILSVMTGNFLVIAIAVQALRRGVPSARYFLVSSVVFNLGYILFVLQQSNVFWLGTILMHAPQIGIALEVCLLSLAMADRIRRGNEDLARQKAATVQAEKMSALGRMAGEIAHEIANPLAIIHGHAVLIQKEAALPHIREFAALIESTSNRISKVVKGMRALTRDSRRDPFQTVSMESIIQDATSLCQERARARGVRLLLPLPNEFCPTASCRGSEICQVLVNLISNSIDAVEGQPEPWVRVECRPGPTGRIEVAVTDSGAGIPTEIRSRIHEPFFTTKEAGKGLGLGLSISRTIVEHHGGSLFLDEASPRTRFVFSVPAASADGKGRA
jgi:signal transduction histidine kinase